MEQTLTATLQWPFLRVKFHWFWVLKENFLLQLISFLRKAVPLTSTMTWYEKINFMSQVNGSENDLFYRPVVPESSLRCFLLVFVCCCFFFVLWKPIASFLTSLDSVQSCRSGTVAMLWSGLSLFNLFENGVRRPFFGCDSFQVLAEFATVAYRCEIVSEVSCARPLAAFVSPSWLSGRPRPKIHVFRISLSVHNHKCLVFSCEV